MELQPHVATAKPTGVVLSTAKIAPEQVQPCDFKTVGGVDEARLVPLVKTSEALALALPQALQSRLKLTCEIEPQGSEREPCRAFLDKAGNSYLVMLELGAHADIAFLQIDPTLLFPVIDRLLGGRGEASELSREVTDIEDQIAKDFVKVIGHELQAAWKPFNVSVLVGARQSSAQLQTMFSADESAVVFSYLVNMEPASGTLQLMLPVSSLGIFLGTKTTSIREASRKGTMNARFVEKALDWSFALELTLVGAKVPANELLNLGVGKILPLGVSVRTPGVLKIGGHDAFQALPVRSGKRRGAQLLDRLPQKGHSETGNTI